MACDARHNPAAITLGWSVQWSTKSQGAWGERPDTPAKGARTEAETRGERPDTPAKGHGPEAETRGERPDTLANLQLLLRESNCTIKLLNGKL